jgi:L-fuconolactonase
MKIDSGHLNGLRFGGYVGESDGFTSSTTIDRRRFLAGVGAAAVLGAVSNAAAAPHRDIPIIDTHIHLFDANRPQGAPYKGPKEFTSHVSLPADYRRLAVPLGIKGAIAVEASFWIEDNLWLLETAQSDDIMVGVVGWLQPEKSEFKEYFDRYRRNPLYRGIRLRGKNIITDQLENPAFVDNLKLVSQADLVLDTANPDLNLLKAVVRLNDTIPDLRIVLDHLPVMDPTPQESTEYLRTLEEIRQRPNLFVKLSEILHRVNDEVAKDLASHQERLDLLMKVFGPNRVLFGSDYPNSVGTATLPEVIGLVKQYFAKQPRSVAENYFWKNSARCYKWIKRTTQQPAP